MFLNGYVEVDAHAINYQVINKWYAICTNDLLIVLMVLVALRSFVNM